MYRSAPFFRHYLEAIGVARGAISMSPETEDVQRLPHREGRGPDACFPAKLAQAHVAAVLAGTRRSRFDVLFFPILTHAKTSVRGCRDSMACPLVTGAPLVCRALFGRGSNALPNGTRLSMPVLNLTEPELLAEQLHRAVREFVPGLSQREHLAALNEAGRAQAHIERQMELDGIRLIARARHERRAAVVLLGRPYHVDPGIHHDIGSELRALGRSTLSLRALPRARAELLEGPERRSDFSAFWDVGREGHALTNSGCAEKLAAARLVASEPYLVALEFSSFKCGQDAALYASISAHARGAGKPFLALHDMDETRPVASLRLRLRTFLHGVEAYEHALRQHAS
jgi:predicted nucleotide-binding protein (sugar kinase/HSP70/actin superfamily)